MNNIKFDDTNLEFDVAVEKVRNLQERPSDEILLKLYGLYKQSINGNNHTQNASMFDFKGKAKWNAWTSESGKGKNKSKKEYIDLVNKLIKLKFD